MSVENRTATKLLEITLHNYLHFISHVDDVLTRSNPALHAVITTKKSELDKAILLTYYCSVKRPEVTYAEPGWYFNISISDSERLESRQKLCLCVTV